MGKLKKVPGLFFLALALILSFTVTVEGRWDYLYPPGSYNASEESDSNVIYFGDVNNDGVINVGDAISVLRHIVGLQPLEYPDGVQRADVNLDGNVNVTDAIQVLRYIVGLINKFTPADPAVVFTETALRYVMEKTNVNIVNTGNCIELTEPLIINRDITILNLNIKASDKKQGTIAVKGTLGKETNFYLSATPAAGYYFESWVIDGSKAGKDKELEFTVPVEYTEVEANFQPVIIPVASAGELNNIRKSEPNLFGVGTEREGEYEGGLDKNYELVADIDLDIAPFNEGEGWEPLGYHDDNNPADNVPFTGNFDGGGYEITNLMINRLETISEESVGLFGYTGEDALIIDVSLRNINITAGMRAGGLAGVNKGSVIGNCAAGIVTGEFVVGGLVGLNDEGVITDSYSEGVVSGSGGVGGLVGGNTGDITGSYALADVTGYPDANGLSATGGLAGGNFGTIINCYAGYEDSNTFIEGVFFVGGLVGLNYGIIDGSYATGDVKGTEDSLDFLHELAKVYNSKPADDVLGQKSNIDDFEVPGVGGLVGVTYRGEITDSYAEGEVRAHLIAGGFIGVNITGEISGSHAKGDVTSGYFAGGFAGIHRYNLITECYALGNVKAEEPEGGIKNDGEFDYEIIRRGMFGGRAGGFVGGNFAETTNCYAGGNVEGYGSVGGFAGINANLIEGSYALGDVKRTERTTKNEAFPVGTGGLVGVNFSVYVENKARIHNSFASGNAIDKSESSEESVEVGLGGLVGINYTYSVIAGSYASGDVGDITGDINVDYVGGLVGFVKYRAVKDSYALGNVSGAKYVGGLVGFIGDMVMEDSDYGYIENCYAIGRVDGIQSTGGLVGTGNSAYVISSYFNTQTTEQADSAGGKPRTTQQMTNPCDEGTYTNWNFDYIWAKDKDFDAEDKNKPGSNGGYPYLRWQRPVTTD